MFAGIVACMALFVWFLISCLTVRVVSCLLVVGFACLVALLAVNSVVVDQSLLC